MIGPGHGLVRPKGDPHALIAGATSNPVSPITVIMFRIGIPFAYGLINLWKKKWF